MMDSKEITSVNPVLVMINIKQETLSMSSLCDGITPVQLHYSVYISAVSIYFTSSSVT